MILSHVYRRNTGTFTGILVPVAGIHPLSMERGWMNTGSITGTMAITGTFTGGIPAVEVPQAAVMTEGWDRI